MQVSELLDQIANDADDNGSAFRNSARRWLNLTRSYIADRALWQQALNPTAEMSVASSTTGLHLLQDTSGTQYMQLTDDRMYDATNEVTIAPESFQRLRSIDPNRETTGQPEFWADAGMNANGIKRIYLWPLSDGTRTVNFAGVKLLADLTSSDDTLQIDPYYGPITPWAETFVAGMRWHHELNTNEDFTQAETARRVFDRLIARRATRNRIAPASGLQLSNIREQILPARGRFDPGHFQNR